ncbi:uncharacterized protein GGS22DRAFT_101777 [Annulohypoxylon maeteangense]|uniref:uncharacterized protein n=1 Tax=Annulohypoxylon maeteangense TaxID=1927788 RepID=UPI0020078DCD|nr:uncharacterized protein GGS22DRAFT_101777 [Annulohypoxylon maeteangense]KAI0879951.1 hypothetical protein GGS22DRAFT_101777 [Annulohypoxylon maeteangense]
MHLHHILPSLILPSTVLSLPTSPTTTSPDDSSSTCSLYPYPSPPTNPPSCWAWETQPGDPSNYCGPTTLSIVASASTTSSTWLDGCTSLRDAQVASNRDYLLATYSTDNFNTLLTSGECAFQVQPATPPSSDQVYIGGTDVVDVLGSAIDAAKASGGKNGVEGSMTCAPGEVKWRVVPI